MEETPSSVGRHNALVTELERALSGTGLSLVHAPPDGKKNAHAILRCTRGHEFPRVARSAINSRSSLCPICRKESIEAREAAKLPDPRLFDWIPPHVPVGRGTKPRDLRDQRFGALTALRVVAKHESGSLMWECKCDCGTVVVKKASSLCAGKSKSCGCVRGTAKAYSTRAPNKGRRYLIKGPDEVYSSKKAWGKAARRAHGDACEICGWDAGACDVHHRVPRNAGGLNTVENAIVLCPNHHRLAHEMGLKVLLAAEGKSAPSKDSI